MSDTLTPRSRSSRQVSSALMLVLALVLTTTACTGRPSTPSGYGNANSSVERNFVAGCIAPNGTDSEVKVSRDVCQCTYNKVKQTVPFDEFKQVIDDLGDDPAPLPDKFQKILSDCVASKG